MKCLTLMISLFIISKSFSCVESFDVTEANIDSIPILGFIEETNGVVNCSLYFKNEGSLLGLNEVSISVVNQNNQSRLFSALKIENNYSVEVLQSVTFSIAISNIINSKLMLSTYKEDVTDNGGIHVCRNYYDLPIALVKHRFINNPYGFTKNIHELDSITMSRFLERKYKKNSNQQVDPIVKTPVDEVEAQSTQGHP